MSEQSQQAGPPGNVTQGAGFEHTTVLASPDKDCTTMERKQSTQVTPECHTSWDRSDPTQQELTAVLRAIKHDPTLMGVLSLGKDGVMRSLTADRRVVDAVGLSPAQIAAFRAREPPQVRSGYEMDEGADGTKVPRAQWFSPDKGLLPEPMSQEVREKIEKRRREREERGEGSLQKSREEMEARGMTFA